MPAIISRTCRPTSATTTRAHGIEAFCYYDYWFAGRRVLERPLQEVVASGRPDFPFCICWANQSWRGVWYGARHRTLIEQTYPGVDDHRRHFEALLPAFADPRYVHVNGRPLLLIFRPGELPDPRRTLDLWRELAVRAGLPPLYIVGQHSDPHFDPHRLGFDASLLVKLAPRSEWRRPDRRLRSFLGQMRGVPTVFAYDRMVRDFATSPVDGIRSHPCVIPNWDNTPRSGAGGLVLHDSSPEHFRAHVRTVMNRVRAEPADERLIFIKSWNEWAEGNHLEPDRKWGRAYLEALRDELVATS